MSDQAGYRVLSAHGQDICPKTAQICFWSYWSCRLNKATQSSHSCADFKQSDVRADFCADDGDGKAKKNSIFLGIENLREIRVGMPVFIGRGFNLAINLHW